MKLQNLFEEENSLNKEIVKKIYDDCRFFFDQINNDVDNSILYRGINENDLHHFEKIASYTYRGEVRKDRTPLNTPQKFHKIVDDWMEKKLGHKFRSSALFCTGEYYTALKYGAGYCILPIGEFKYAWSPFIEDLYNDTDELSNVNTKTTRAKEAHGSLENSMIDTLENANYKTTDLKRAIDEFPAHEIMIGCSEYYAIKRNTYQHYFVPLFQMVAK